MTVFTDPTTRGTLEMLHMKEHFPAHLSHDDERIIARKIGSIERFYKLNQFMEHLQIPPCKAIGCSKRNIPEKIRTIFSKKEVHPELHSVARKLTTPQPTKLTLGTLSVLYERIIALQTDSHLEKICLRQIREYFRK